jgi:hypothetical protein
MHGPPAPLRGGDTLLRPCVDPLFF